MTFDQKNRNIVSDDDGGMTIFLVIWMIIFIVFSGIAVDSSNAWRERTVLQATADATAHAALIDIEDQGVALATANYYAELNMPSAGAGDVLADADVEFGSWTGFAFIPQADFDPVAPLEINAVRTTTYRAAENSNRLRTYFLTLTGFNAWDISAQAIATRQRKGGCLVYDNVIMSEGKMHLNPNSTYEGNLCMHSNDHIRSQPNVTWGDGAIASMPDDHHGDNIHEAFQAHNPQITYTAGPPADYPKNPGLIDSLEGNDYIPLLSEQLGTMISSAYNGYTEYLPQGVPASEDGTVAAVPVFTNLTGTNVVAVDLKKLPLPTSYAPGKLYKLDCGGLNASINKLTVSWAPADGNDFASAAKGIFGSLMDGLFAAHAGPGVVTKTGQTLKFVGDFTGVAVVTDCNLNFNGGEYIDSFFATTATGNQAVDIVNSLPNRFGKDDDCAPGGDVVVLSMGTIAASAKASFYDAKFIAAGDVHLAAKAGGISEVTTSDSGTAVGINIQAGGDAHITALANFDGCGATGGWQWDDWTYKIVR